MPVQSLQVNGNKLRSLRALKNWSMEKLAENAGLSTKTIQRAESSECISPRTVNKISDALGCSQTEILVGSGSVMKTRQENYHGSSRKHFFGQNNEYLINHNQSYSIKLNNKNESKYGYPWFFQEINSDGNQVGRDYIPCRSSFSFRITESVCHRQFKFDGSSFFNDGEAVSKDQFLKELSDEKSFIAKLAPEYITDEKLVGSYPKFSMLGTDRIITKFFLTVKAIEEGEEKYCKAFSYVGCFESDTSDHANPDCLVIDLGLPEDELNMFIDVIFRTNTEVARLSISKASGFYTECSKSTSTNIINVLAGHDNAGAQVIDTPEGCEINPPRLGDIEQLDIKLITSNQSKIIIVF